MMNVQLLKAVTEGDLELRQLFAETLVDSEFQEEARSDPEVFHSTLRLADQRNWIHYSQLAQRVDLSPAHVSKMFKEDVSARFTPGVAMRLEVLTQLSRLLAADVDRMKCGLVPIAHLTANQLVQTLSSSNEPCVERVFPVIVS